MLRFVARCLYFGVGGGTQGFVCGPNGNMVWYARVPCTGTKVSVMECLAAEAKSQKDSVEGMVVLHLKRG